MYSILPRLQNNALQKRENHFIMEQKNNKLKNNKTQVVEFNEVKNTPFYIGKVEVTKDETNETKTHYRIFIGNQAVSEPMATEKECRAMINRKPWTLICAVAIITSQKVQHNEI